MRTRSKKAFFLRGALFGIVAVLFFSFLVMLLWNWLMPALFSLTIISFWQAMGLLALSKILFGGFHHRHHYHDYNRKKMWEDRFRSRMEHFKNCHKSESEKEEKPE